MIDGIVVQHPANDGVRLPRLGERRINHHSIAIEGAERENAPIERGRDFVRIRQGFRRRFADENRVTGTVGVVAVMRYMIDEQQRLARLCIVQLDAAGKGQLPVGKYSNRAVAGKLLIAEAEEVGELGRLEAGNAVGHPGVLLMAKSKRFPPLALKGPHRELAPRQLRNSPPCIPCYPLLGARQPMRGAQFPSCCAPFNAWHRFTCWSFERVDNSGGIQASLAGRYATALFGLARDEKQIDAVTRSLATVEAAIAESPDLRTLATSPLIDRVDAGRAMRAVTPTLGIDPITGKFLGVLADKGRLRELKAVFKTFRQLAAQHRGETTAEVTSARPLDDGQMTALKSNLKARLGRDVAVEAKVDPEILGGIIVRHGSQMIDASIRTKLNTLAQAMKG